MQKFKSRDAWTINYLHLLAELGHIRVSLVKNKRGLYWVSNKIIYCLFQSNISNVALTICKRFIRNQVFHNKLIVYTLHVFVFIFFVFTINVQILQHKPRYASCVIKEIDKICDKIMTMEKYKKLRNCLFKMKNWIKLFLKKMLFA